MFCLREHAGSCMGCCFGRCWRPSYLRHCYRSYVLLRQSSSESLLCCLYEQPDSRIQCYPGTAIVGSQLRLRSYCPMLVGKPGFSLVDPHFFTHSHKGTIFMTTLKLMHGAEEMRIRWCRRG